ncbi:MAG: beta strand repeat-containing protein [Vicinamibacterales bacterium]
MLKRTLACLAMLGSLSICAWAQSPVQYIYDDLGRLVGVIDQSGNAATYTYDAVGNLLSITRTSAGTVSIISVSPSTGAAPGATVTINGTGFSATTSDDTVTFNGTAATVTSATTNTLTVVVPSGATSGTIGVTTPSGSATSGSPFTVTTGNAAPTITAFTPSVGVAGTSVTITGANFDAAPSNDRLHFNTTAAPPASVTTTTIGVNVPAPATSGHLSVATPFGMAVSTDDFFIPPPPHSVADVLVTGRLTLGTGSVVTIGTGGKIALELFDLPRGHRASVTFTAGTFFAANAYVIDPHGATVANTLIGSSGFIDVFPGQIDGTSTVEIAPLSSYTGHATVTVYDMPADLSGSITPGGDPLTLSFTTPGQNAKVTFTGTSGERVSLKISSGPLGGVSMLNPDGSVLATGSIGAVTSFIDTLVLPTTGTYALTADPLGSGTGNVTFTLYDVPADLTGPIIAGGSPVNLTLGTPGQNATLTFSGTVGHRMSLAINGSAVTAIVSIRTLSGTVLGSATSGVISTFIEPVTLPTTDTYNVVVDPGTYNTGNITLTLYDVPADVTGTITTDGTPANVTIGTPGQNGSLTFSGTAGHRVSLRISGSAPSGTVQIRTSTGTVLGSASSGVLSAFMEPVTLSATDTYTIYVNPGGNATGSLTLNLYDVPADTTGSATVNGSGVGVTLSTPGQNGTVTFSGTASQQVTVHVTGNTISPVTIKLLKPDGTPLTSTTSSSTSFNLSSETLPTTGTYTIVIDPGATAIGTLTVTVTHP